jgi:hypothetical protein
MKTAKPTYRNEFSSIHAHIDNILGVAQHPIPTSTRASRKTRPASGNHAAKQNCQPSPRAWSESFAFAIDG